MSLYLGLDSSTQGIKAALIDADKGRIEHLFSVNFASELPEYKSADGILENPDPLVKHSDPLMWVAALDLLLKKMKDKGVDLKGVKAVSGSGQQHGSVYLNSDFKKIFKSLDPSKPLAEQIAPALSRPSSPIWMDSSTSEECAEIAKAAGGARSVQEITGSPPIERFTGPQIRRFYKKNPDLYGKTARIHLVSSFMASVLCGGDAPIDYGDGAGMNLLNISTLKWDAKVVSATAPGLMAKLPPPAKSSSTAGKLHAYFAKYGLTPGIPVITWSGDNPCSLVGVGAAEPGTAVVSLGTSDTFFAAMASAHVDPQGCGHVFGNPAGGFMSLICFKNGSLAREKVRAECSVEWDFFDKTAIKETEPGNEGNIMLPYFIPEITPLVLKAKPVYEGTADFVAGKASPAVKLRAIVESQALSMLLHSKWIGEDFKVLRLTGGASKSSAICRIFADVFQAEVQKIAVSDSAALGAAMRAANAEGGFKWADLNAKFAAPVERISCDRKNKEVYAKLLDKYARLEKKAKG